METKTEKLEISHIKILESSMRYKQVVRLDKILEIISICKSRISREMNLCDDLYGRTVTGERLGNQNSSTYIARYVAVIERLKKYYNNNLAKLTAFEVK